MPDIEEYFPGIKDGTVTIGYEHVYSPSTITVAPLTSGYKADFYTTGTNDHIKIQDALDAINSLGGGSLYLKGGTYTLGAALTIGSKTTIYGDGRSTVITLATNANCHILTLKAVTTELVILRDFVLNGNRSNQSAAVGTIHGIYFNNSKLVSDPDYTYIDARHIIEHLLIYQVKGDGFHFEGTVSNPNDNPGSSHIIDVTCLDCSRNGFRFGGDDLRFILCKSGASGEEGWYTAAPCGNLTLSSCKSYFSGGIVPASGVGFRLNDCPRAKLTSCEAQDNKHDGFQVHSNATDILFADCQADSNGRAGTRRYGFYIVDGDRISIVGGQTVDRNSGESRVQDYGIRIDSGATHVLVDGVGFYNNYTGTILSTNTSAKIRNLNGINSGPNTVVRVAPLSTSLEAEYYTDGTDDQVEIQLAINAVVTAGGGLVVLRPGNYVAGEITLKDTVSLEGEARGEVKILKKASTQDLILSENFYTAASSGNAFVGIAHGHIKNLTIEGGAQVASGASNYRNADSLIKLYAWDFLIEDVRLNYCFEVGLYTEHDNDWNDDGTFNTYEFGENVYRNIKIKNYGQVGWVNRGSHDSIIDEVYISSSDESGLTAQYGYVQQTNSAVGQKYGSNGATIKFLHVWGNHAHNCVYLENSNILEGFIYAEGCDESAIKLVNSTANRFSAFVGFCVAGIELSGTSHQNIIEATVESNVSGALFQINTAGHSNELKHVPSYGSPSGAVFDLSTGGTYTGTKNRFIPWDAYTGTLFTGTPGPTDFVDGANVTAPQRRISHRMKNTSGGTLNLGDVVVIKAVANGDEITTTTTAGDDNVYGMVAETIANNAYGYVMTEGKTVSLKVDGTTDIAIGDLLTPFTTAKISAKAAAGDMVFAKALEAYTTNDSAGVIDALLIIPRLI